MSVRRAPHNAAVRPHQLILAERDQRSQTGTPPKRGPHPIEHARDDACAAPQHGAGTMSNSTNGARPGQLHWARRPASLPQRAEAAAGRSLPSGRTEGRPHDQLAWLATWLDVDAVSESDAVERSRTTTRLARARQRGQYCTAR